MNGRNKIRAAPAPRPKAQAPAPEIRPDNHSDVEYGGEYGVEAALSPEMAGLQRYLGNRTANRQPELLSRVLLQPSNRATIQRMWPFGDKTLPIDQAEEQLGNLGFEALTTNSMWSITNTSAAGTTALATLTEIDTKLKALKVTVNKGKYKTPDDKRRQTDFAGNVDTEIAKVGGYISTTKTQIAALKMQEALAATGAAAHAGGGGANGPADPMDKIKSVATTGVSTATGAMSVESGTRSAQLLGAQNRQAMLDNATGGELEVNKVAATGRSGVQGFLDDLSKFVTSVKEQLFNISWVKKMIDFLEPLKNWTFLLSALADAYSLYTTYERYSALKVGADTVTASGSADDLAQSITYGFAKVKRALYWNITKFGLSLSKTIARMITLLTGGAAALVTESIALAADLASAVMSVGRKAKGLYKAIRGSRGKNRKENAGKIYDSAMSGDSRALKLIIAFKPFGLLGTLKNKTYIDNIPTTEPEMLRYLHAKGERKKIVTEIADKLKSQ